MTAPYEVLDLTTLSRHLRSTLLQAEAHWCRRTTAARAHGESEPLLPFRATALAVVVEGHSGPDSSPNCVSHQPVDEEDLLGWVEGLMAEHSPSARRIWVITEHGALLADRRSGPAVAEVSIPAAALPGLLRPLIDVMIHGSVCTAEIVGSLTNKRDPAIGEKIGLLQALIPMLARERPGYAEGWRAYAECQHCHEPMGAGSCTGCGGLVG